jgi:N-acylneuraminate cytidylyltransferase
MSLDIVGYIFARGGSKGVPRKNIRHLAGKPLIAYAIETAKQSRYITRVIVSTDDPEIAGIAKRFGADVPFLRPSELAGDRSPEWLAWRHAIQEAKKESGKIPDIFVSIPTTSPLRDASDIDRCISCLQESDADIVVTVKKADRSPYFNMVTLDGNGFAKVVMQAGSTLVRRQDAPTVYDMTTVAYASRPEFIIRAVGIFCGKVRVVEVPPERAIDIDTELDFRIAEFLISDKKKCGNKKMEWYRYENGE